MRQPAKDSGNRLKTHSQCHCLSAKGTRREFLMGASYLAVAALVSAGVRVRDAEAFPISFISTNSESTECSYSIPSSDGASIDSENQVILVRNANRVYAFALACPHENTALRWRVKEGDFQCPRHKAKYQPDGIFVSGKRTRNMDRFSVLLESQKIIVNLNKLYRSDVQKAEWDSSFVTV